MYKCAKYTEWGDRLPATIRDTAKPVTRWELWSKSVGYLPKNKRPQNQEEE